MFGFLNILVTLKVKYKIEKIVKLNLFPPLQVTACKSGEKGRLKLVSGQKRKARKPMRWDARALIEIRKEQKRTKLCIPKAPIARYFNFWYLSVHVKLVAI